MSFIEGRWPLGCIIVGLRLSSLGSVIVHKTFCSPWRVVFNWWFGAVCVRFGDCRLCGCGCLVFSTIIFSARFFSVAVAICPDRSVVLGTEFTPSRLSFCSVWLWSSGIVSVGAGGSALGRGTGSEARCTNGFVVVSARLPAPRFYAVSTELFSAWSNVFFVVRLTDGIFAGSLGLRGTWFISCAPKFCGFGCVIVRVWLLKAVCIAIATGLC
jgi:hypothetical protein